MSTLTRLSVGFVAIATAAAFVFASVTAFRDLRGGLRGGTRADTRFGSPAEAGKIANPAITESSGIVASRREAGLFWTHNDSGARAVLFAIDEHGRMKGTYTIPGARAYDWEDIAAGPGPTASVSYLYIGDIGDNTKRRKEIVVYRVVEPIIAKSDGGEARRQLKLDARLRLAYPDGAHDAEALLVHPRSGDLYVITKTMASTAAVYVARAPLSTSQANRLERVGGISIPSLFGSLVTGADVTRDGQRVVICNYLSAYELALGATSATFDDIWKRPLTAIEVPARPQGESICYSPNGNAIYMTSEGVRSSLWVVRRLNPR